MSKTIFDVRSNDGKNYLYSGDSPDDLELLMIFERNSQAHIQFIEAASEYGTLVLDIHNYGQAVERIGLDLAQKHFTQVPELTTKKYIRYSLLALAGIVLLSFMTKK